MTAKTLWLGLDVGSTTVKLAVVNPDDESLVFSLYERHNADQAGSAQRLLEQAHAQFPGHSFSVVVCGSGGKPIVEALNGFFVQEVVANSFAIKRLHPATKVAIELGGQDAKVIFFQHDELTGKIIGSDMRMNGSCAGGTGAFIDQVAELLNLRIEEFGSMAEKGETVYEISGRCGVFAKTDIQPLLSQGVTKEDICLSTFHAIAKQTIGGLAQGREIRPPVIFEGGPLCFNPRLVGVFAERLGLSPEQVIVPDKPELIVAYGAALAIAGMFATEICNYRPEAIQLLGQGAREVGTDAIVQKPYFESAAELAVFRAKHKLGRIEKVKRTRGSTLDVYVGLDAGSTTSKFVLIDENEDVVDRYYAGNQGNPLQVVKDAFIDLRTKYDDLGVRLNVRGVGSTGYGEAMFAKAFKVDYHTVETVSHAEAALKIAPKASFILDIGGQDMKAIYIRNGVVTGITLNEACSSGCGSFVETYAKSLKIAVEDVADLAFQSISPSRLGSRCTVFMNSSIITEQKKGKAPEDIMAGICRSIIENVFTKVIRIANYDSLGDTIIVQGGTFKNDAVLRAIEEYTERKVIRPEFPGEMGAIGIALLTKKRIREKEQQTGEIHRTSFIGLEAMDEFSFMKKPGLVCPFCNNHCSRTVVSFNDNSHFVTGNRCERGEVIGDPKDAVTRKELKSIKAKIEAVPDMMGLREKMLSRRYDISQRVDAGSTIGLPRVLEFWNSLPFWHTLYRSLGFKVVLSSRSTYRTFESGLPYVASDTICLPAKLAHGHTEDLIAKKVDRIFMPSMIRVPPTGDDKGAVNVCAIVQGYPIVVNESHEPSRRDVVFEKPAFHWYSKKSRDRQLTRYITDTYEIDRKVIQRAIDDADKAQKLFRETLVDSGRSILDELEGTDRFAVVVAARSYHADSFVNHDLSKHFTGMGIPVLTTDSLPGVTEISLDKARADIVNPFHARMFASAIKVAQHPNLELAQIVSFGCGHDGVITDEMVRLMSQLTEKEMLVLKLDESAAKGPLSLRVKSFIETIRSRRKKGALPAGAPEALGDPFAVKFERGDRRDRIILAPNLSEGFTQIASSVMARAGCTVEALPYADERAIELGKKFVHNDMCFPAQLNVGEFLREMEKGERDRNRVALGLAKNCDDCRAGQYATIARKALDEAGYDRIPIVTIGEDTKEMHPGFRADTRFKRGLLWGLAMTDALTQVKLRVRPYEMQKGRADEIYDGAIEGISEALKRSKRRALDVFVGAIDEFNGVETECGERRPRVFLTGEILVNFHPTANQQMVRYLESSGMEVMLPNMVDFFRRDVVKSKEAARRNLIGNPMLQKIMANVGDHFYRSALDKVATVLSRFRFYEPSPDIYELSDLISDMMDKTYTVGEGWLLAADIIHQARMGVHSFVIVQPFGCMPNHISGRGIIKPLLKRFPHIQILPLDFDPDTSFGNIENRLQMLIINAREKESLAKEGAVPSQQDDARRRRGCGRVVAQASRTVRVVARPE